MFKQFRKAVEKIIEKYGEMKPEEFYAFDEKQIRVKKENFLDLVIEKAGSTIFIGYYRTQNGDLISDPVFVFEYRDNLWYPIRLEQTIGDFQVGLFEEGQYQYYPRRFKDVRSFATSCATEWKAYYL